MRSVRHCKYKRRNELRDYEPVPSLMVLLNSIRKERVYQYVLEFKLCKRIVLFWSLKYTVFYEIRNKKGARYYRRHNRWYSVRQNNGIRNYLPKKGQYKLTLTRSVINSSSPIVLLLMNLLKHLARRYLMNQEMSAEKNWEAIVFNDKSARERLNAILHPLIIQRSPIPCQSTCE